MKAKKLKGEGLKGEGLKGEGLKGERAAGALGTPAQPPTFHELLRGEFRMVVGEGHLTVHVGNLTAGELCWLGELVKLMCDPAKAQQWADFKTKARFIAYVEGALECVSANTITRVVTAEINRQLATTATTGHARS